MAARLRSIAAPLALVLASPAAAMPTPASLSPVPALLRRLAEDSDFRQRFADAPRAMLRDSGVDDAIFAVPDRMDEERPVRAGWLASRDGRSSGTGNRVYRRCSIPRPSGLWPPSRTGSSAAAHLAAAKSAAGAQEAPAPHAESRVVLARRIMPMFRTPTALPTCGDPFGTELPGFGMSLPLGVTVRL